MKRESALNLVLVSTPVGCLGSGRGGGVELTISSLTKGLLELGHQITLVAPKGSVLPSGCSGVDLREVGGVDQPSWQRRKFEGPALIPPRGVLPGLWSDALDLGGKADAVINFGYDWLPIWLTKRVVPRLFHLISMGGVSEIMQDLIGEVAISAPSRFAFHTHRQAADFSLIQEPIVVGNGFDLGSYEFQSSPKGPLGWVGRVSPEKGLEDAAAVAAALDDRLLVWGVIDDPEYAKRVEESVPTGTIEWMGFFPTSVLQLQLGACRALINTPKWNEAYGNVIVEAMACGVPVVAYDRGGPGELIVSGLTGWLVPPNDLDELISATTRVDQIDRKKCRKWAEEHASLDIFASLVEQWIRSSIASEAIGKGPKEFFS